MFRFPSPVLRRTLWVQAALLALVMLLLTSPAEAGEPARLLLQAETAADGTIRATAVVTDQQGAPVADAAVTFKVRTTFGWLTVAEVTTDRRGRAEATLSTAAAGELSAETGDETVVRATMLIAERRSAALRLRPGREVLNGLSPQPGFISPYLVPLQIAIVGLILAGVWSTYGYVVWLLHRIRQDRG